jgi:hypothetical protein
VSGGDDDFDRHFVGLLTAAREASALLRRFGEDRWATWLDTDAARIERGDKYGLDGLLTAFGGMGSLNDLVIHPLNGHRVSTDEVDTVNQRLSESVAQVWHHAAR